MDLPRGLIGEFEGSLWVPDGTASLAPPSENAKPIRNPHAW